jgi:hypothetical protein
MKSLICLEPYKKHVNEWKCGMDRGSNFTVEGFLQDMISYSAGQEIPCFYGTRRFLTVFTKACYLTSF